MEKLKLSEMIIYYESKKEKKDSDFGYYFEEQDVEKKLSRLKLMCETVGDIELPLNQIRAFLYVGQQYQDKNRIKLTPAMIKDATGILKEHEDMPTKFLLEILDKYDEECFKEYDIKGYINALMKEETDLSKLTRKYSDIIADKKSEIDEFYQKEKEKLEVLKDEYDIGFVKILQRQIVERHIKSEDVIKLIPSPEFIEASKVKVDHGYTIKSGEDIVWRVLAGYVDLDKFEDDEKVMLGYSSTGNSYVYASFTKKEYLEEIEKQRQQKPRR